MTRLTVLVIALTLTGSSSSARQNELSLQSFMAVGKGAGACGILTQQLTFQETTQMPGGAEFVVRFWTTEAARLGMTLQQYAADHCQTTVASYGKLWEMAEAK